MSTLSFDPETMSLEAQAALQRMMAAALQNPSVQAAAETEAQKVFIDKYAVPVAVGAAALLGLAFFIGRRTTRAR